MKSPFDDKPNIRRYSIIPARAMQDETLTRNEIRVLAALGMYANSYGVCWPSQITVGRHLGVNAEWVSRAVGKLKRKGYIRKLSTRDYPKGVVRRSHRPVNRYQVLWEGNDPLPSKEEFYAPRPRFAVDPEDDDGNEVHEHKQEGVQGDASNDYITLAHTFKRAVEEACGLVRLPEPSLAAAKLLNNQGVTDAEVREATINCTKDALRRGRTPPATLDQVAAWAALYKN